MQAHALLCSFAYAPAPDTRARGSSASSAQQGDGRFQADRRGPSSYVPQAMEMRESRIIAAWHDKHLTAPCRSTSFPRQHRDPSQLWPRRTRRHAAPHAFPRRDGSSRANTVEQPAAFPAVTHRPSFSLTRANVSRCFVVALGNQ
jgi:hypothetical protein